MQYFLLESIIEKIILQEINQMEIPAPAAGIWAYINAYNAIKNLLPDAPPMYFEYNEDYFGKQIKYEKSGRVLVGPESISSTEAFIGSGHDIFHALTANLARHFLATSLKLVGKNARGKGIYQTNPAKSNIPFVPKKFGTDQEKTKNHFEKRIDHEKPDSFQLPQHFAEEVFGNGLKVLLQQAVVSNETMSYDQIRKNIWLYGRHGADIVEKELSGNRSTGAFNKAESEDLHKRIDNWIMKLFDSEDQIMKKFVDSYNRYLGISKKIKWKKPEEPEDYSKYG